MITSEGLEYLHEQIELAARCGYGDEDHIREEIEDLLSEELLDEPPAARRALTAELMSRLDRALAAQREREARWTEATMNDRIEEAFLVLEAEGIVAVEDAGATTSDGWSDVHERSSEVPEAWGGIFFHRQDVERGVLGEGLHLSFGAFSDDDDHERESLRLASRACEVLAEHGVPTDWEGDLEHRIHIRPFEWRKRRHRRPTE